MIFTFAIGDESIFLFHIQYDAQGTGTIDVTEFLGLIANRDKKFLNDEVSNMV